MTAAAHFGLTLGEMLRIGENLLSGRIVFPWSDQLYQEYLLLVRKSCNS